MADFVQTMKDWRRMCKYYASNCDRCPLCNFECGAVPRKMKYHTDDQVQAIILEWVKVHPEPVYPTWGEYIRSITGLDPVEVNGMRLALTRTIPADIAEKLGLQPKEAI